MSAIRTVYTFQYKLQLYVHRTSSIFSVNGYITLYIIGPPISSSVGASSSISTVAPTSAPLSAGALAGIGVAAGVLGLVVLLCLVLIIWTSYRTGKHKHQRPVRFT